MRFAAAAAVVAVVVAAVVVVAVLNLHQIRRNQFLRELKYNHFKMFFENEKKMNKIELFNLFENDLLVFPVSKNPRHYSVDINLFLE